MEEVIVKGMGDRLSTLEIARSRVEDAELYVEKAEYPYRIAIGVLEREMGNDNMVIEARDRLVTAKQIEADATEMVSRAAIAAWESGLTDGSKEWAHDNWQIRLRTTLSPVVAHVEDFITHLVEIGATGIVKKLTLNRKATTDLNDKIKLDGLEIEEKTTCSVKLSN